MRERHHLVVTLLEVLRSWPVIGAYSAWRHHRADARFHDKHPTRVKDLHHVSILDSARLGILWIDVNPRFTHVPVKNWNVAHERVHIELLARRKVLQRVLLRVWRVRRDR